MKIIRHVTTLAALLLIALPGLAQVNITGRVLSESGEALPGAVVQIGPVSASSDSSGHFRLTTDEAEIYMLRYSAENHFPMVHSYSALDFDWRPADSSDRAVVVPEVSLVERVDGRIMLAFGGDTMMGRRFSNPAEGEPVLIRKGHKAADTMALLQYIKPYLELADYASVNLETQVMESMPEQNAPKSYVFFTPPESLLALKASGIDYVTLGNNHTYDYLAEGLESTIEALDHSGMAWSGAGMTEKKSLQPYRVEIGENPVSFLGYVGWAGNFSPNQVARGDEKGGAAHGTAENIHNAVRSEAAQGYLPIVQYHGSREYADEPTLVTESRLKQAIDDGAILAIGHHPHVVQGFEIYNGRLIAYSMGNFIFDQFHYATERSFVLYAWMDRDRLHRAEVMPLRIKGYVPVPATDSDRQAILKRVNELSGRRGLVLRASGGNAVIRPQPEANQRLPASAFGVPEDDKSMETTIWPLNDRAWNDPVETIAMAPGKPVRIRLGQNLLPMGHLESHYLFDAPDRSWISNGPQTVVTNDNAPSGSNVMQLRVPAGQSEGTIGMRTFEYTFEPGTPTTFVLTAHADAPAMVTAYQQWRKRNENRIEALESAKLRTIGQAELTAAGWQELRFDFDSPRVTAVSYRVVLKVAPLDNTKDHHSWFDDIALIEWLSPPLGAGDVPGHVAGKLASHADISR